MNNATLYDNKLLKAIEKRPELYDTNHVHYRNNAMKNKIWGAIATEIALPIYICQKRWKRLKEKYIHRAGNKNTMSTPNTLNRINFLQRFNIDDQDPLASDIKAEPIDFKELSSDSFNSGSDENNVSNCTPSTSTFWPATSMPVVIEMPPLVPLTPSINKEPPTKRLKNNEDTPDIEKILKVLESTEEYDDVDLFCLSIAKDIKKMPEHEQRRMKFEISKLVYLAKFN